MKNKKDFKKRRYFVLILAVALSGCATKTAYLNRQKPPEEVQKDKTACQSVVETSDFKDSDLKRNKFNQCMKDKGYNVVSEEEAEKIQGLKELWVKPGADFKAYEAIFIDKVDLSQVKVKDAGVPDTKASNEDINNLGVEMFKRFSQTLGIVMPVIADKKEAVGRRVLYLSLKLNNISQTNVGLTTALEAAGEMTVVPLPDAPEGDFSFSGTITDFSTQEKLVNFADEVKADKNSSLMGLEGFTLWQKAYNVFDYWADHLAQLLAKERGQEYKSQIGFKLI